MTRRLGVVAVAAVTAAVGVAAVRTPTHAPAQATTGFGPTLAQLERFVESDRGLRFVRPPSVRRLPPTAFAARYRGDLATATGEQPTLLALALDDRAASGPGSPAEPVAATPSMVPGYFDQTTETVVIPTWVDSPYSRYVLVHELTHALQTQHFGAPPASDDGDRALAEAGLVEGDAKRVADDYLATLPAAEADQISYAAFHARDAMYRAEYHDSAASFPYLVGRDFTRYVIEHRGRAGLDAAFRDPPATTADLLQPDRFLANRRAVDVDPPDVPGDAVERGTLGEFMFLMVLATAAGPAAAPALADGWRGGSYATWQSDTGYCTRADVAMASDQTAASAAGAMAGWAREGARRRLEHHGDHLLITSCEAGNSDHP